MTDFETQCYHQEHDRQVTELGRITLASLRGNSSGTEHMLLEVLRNDCLDRLREVNSQIREA